MSKGNLVAGLIGGGVVLLGGGIYKGVEMLTKKAKEKKAVSAAACTTQDSADESDAE